VLEIQCYLRRCMNNDERIAQKASSVFSERFGFWIDFEILIFSFQDLSYAGKAVCKWRLWERLKV